MAQRAYRNRKETTIVSLEKKVQDLRGANEEMNNMFISLYDFAAGKGLLQREPEFARQLQSTTERFLELARSSANDNDSVDEAPVENMVKPVELEPVRRLKNALATPKKQQEDISPESVTNPWGGYIVTREDSPVEEIPVHFDQPKYETEARNEHLIITRATVNNASLPLELMDIQQYRVELPDVDLLQQTFLPSSQLPLPNSYSYSENSFARRLQRKGLEGAFCLINMQHPPPARYQVCQIVSIELVYFQRVGERWIISSEPLRSSVSARLQGSWLIIRILRYSQARPLTVIIGSVWVHSDVRGKR